MTGEVEDIRQQAAEEAIERAEHDAVVDLDDIDRAAEQFHREADDDQPVVWRRP